MSKKKKFPIIPIIIISIILLSLIGVGIYIYINNSIQETFHPGFVHDNCVYNYDYQYNMKNYADGSTEYYTLTAEENQELAFDVYICKLSSGFCSDYQLVPGWSGIIYSGESHTINSDPSGQITRVDVEVYDCSADTSHKTKLYSCDNGNWVYRGEFSSDFQNQWCSNSEDNSYLNGLNYVCSTTPPSGCDEPTPDKHTTNVYYCNQDESSAYWSFYGISKDSSEYYWCSNINDNAYVFPFKGCQFPCLPFINGEKEFSYNCRDSTPSGCVIVEEKCFSDSDCDSGYSCDSGTCTKNKPFCESCFGWLTSKFKNDTEKCDSKPVWEAEGWLNPLKWFGAEIGQDEWCPLFFVIIFSTFIIFIVIILLVRSIIKNRKK